MTRTLTALALALGAAACASAPVAPPPAGPTFEQKMAWILRLEDRRALRDVPPPSPMPPVVTSSARRRPAAVVAPPPPPDLVRLLSDKEARVRRRAALAIGRVGLAEGAAPLVALLAEADADAEVRQMAAFALGLLGARTARDPLVAALADPSPLVQGSAAEALGLIGDAGAADAIGRMVSQIVQSGALAQAPGEGDEARRDTPEAAFRLGIYALVRLKAYGPFAAAVLDAAGQPRVHGWPIAFALQRFEDKRAQPALMTLARDPDPYARAFAVKGLGALKDRAALPVLLPLLSGGATGDRSMRPVLPVLIETIRAVGRIGDPSAIAPLLKLIQAADSGPIVRLEAVSALAGFRDRTAPGLMDTLLDLVADPAPAVRAAALRATAALDGDGFIFMLSGLDPDPQWSVRAALASILATLPPEVGLPRLTSMLGDADARAIPAVLAALTKLRAPAAASVLLQRLKADDPVVRVAAANGIGEIRPPGGAAALADAYRFGERDGTYIARAAALSALTKYGAADAVPVLKTALADKDWALRVRAAALLKTLDPATDAETLIRPAPTRAAPEVYQAPRLVNPSTSTQVYIDTDRGTIQIELAMLDAPLTVENFVTLARNGYFNGVSIHRVVPNFVIQDGDPRGDGEGGPGYTIRDELNERPYLRGTVGMALDWADTGGSQFFITHSPQPHLDAKYTVFGRVVSGMDVVDRIQQGDVIRRVRVWDGDAMK
jgi:cyclophilin family peptidyl-prolyl cis-trans isomerase/HEAT repeat protein